MVRNRRFDFGSPFVREFGIGLLPLGWLCLQHY